MKYIIDNDEIFTTPEEAAQYIIDSLDESYFEEMLNECNDDVNVCGYFFSPAEALYKLDKVAYKEEMFAYYDSLYSDLLYDFQRDRGGEYYGFTVEIVGDEEEE